MTSADSQTTFAKKNNILLSVEDLVTHFFTEEGVVRAVDGVSFKIEKDRVLGLVGETGCGKSVTALSILKLIRHPGRIVSGKIMFQDLDDNEVDKLSNEEIRQRLENGLTSEELKKGIESNLTPEQLVQNFTPEERLERLKHIDLAKLTEEEIRHYRGDMITMIFQDPMNSLNPVIKVGDQIAEVYLLHQKNDIKAEVKREREEIRKTKNVFAARKINSKFIAYRRSAEVLKTVGIPDSKALLDRYPHELSGGMRQRVMIAMGLACHAKLLICDEPTTALDVTIQAQILKLINELRAIIHNSVLFITHNLGIIYQICDNVAVMYAGLIVEYGNVKEVFSHPKHPYTVGLMGSIPRVNPEERLKMLSMIPGLVPNLIFEIPGCRFHPRCSHAMPICQMKRPTLKTTGNIQVQVACFLHDLEEKEKSPELFRKLTDEERKRFDQ